MEYSLLLEKLLHYKILVFTIAILFIISIASLMFVGITGFLMVASFIFSLLLMPLLYGKYRFYFFLWLFIVSIFEANNFKILAGTNPVNFLAAGLTIPFALILIYEEIEQVLKELPFVGSLILFNFIVLANIFRGASFEVSLIDFIKYFIIIFLIFNVYKYIKEKPVEWIFELINVFFIFNALTAIFQKITGTTSIIEGIARARGLAVHPNTLAFAINVYMPILLYMFLTAKSKNKKIYLSISFALSLIALVFAYCKIAFFTLLINILILLLFMPLKVKYRVSIGITILFTLLICLNYAFNLQIFENLTNRFNDNASWQWRLQNWNVIFNDIDFLSFWIGKGTVPSGQLVSILGGGAKFVHNVYLQFLHDFGIFSLSFFIAYLIPAKKFLKTIFDRSKKNRLIYIVPLMIIINTFINMLTDNGAMVRTPLYTSWVVITIFYLNLKYNFLKNQELFSSMLSTKLTKES